MSTEKLGTEVRREQILQAVLAIVAQDGVRGLNVARIARRVGLVPSAIYRHFDSKDAMLAAVLEVLQERLSANVRRVCAMTDDPLERLRGLLMRQVEMIRENAALPRVVFSEEVYGGEPERREAVYRILRGYLEAVADILREGQEQGRIDEELDPPTVAVMFMGLIQPVVMLWHISDGHFEVTRQAERAWRVFARAIAAQSPDGTRAG